jgi:hypothetical protein
MVDHEAAGGTGVVELRSHFAPEPTHHVPLITTICLSSAWKWGGLNVPGGKRTRMT